MTDLNDMNELRSQVERAESSLKSLQDQQKESGNRVKSRLTQTLQAVRQQQQELERTTRLVRHYQSEIAEFRSMLRRLLDCIDSVHADGVASLAEELEAELASLAALSQANSGSERPSVASHVRTPAQGEEDVLVLTEEAEAAASRVNKSFRSSDLGPQRLDRPERPKQPETGGKRPRLFRTGRA